MSSDLFFLTQVGLSFDTKTHHDMINHVFMQLWTLLDGILKFKIIISTLLSQ